MISPPYINRDAFEMLADWLYGHGIIFEDIEQPLIKESTEEFQQLFLSADQFGVNILKKKVIGRLGSQRVFLYKKHCHPRYLPVVNDERQCNDSTAI